MSLKDWAEAVEGVMHLGLPWRMLRSQLISRRASDGAVDYRQWFTELAIQEPNMEVRLLHPITFRKTLSSRATSNKSLCQKNS